MAVTRITQLGIVLLVGCTLLSALPVKKIPPPPPPVVQDQNHSPPEESLSYNRYLQEIVAALETDENFKEKMKNAEQVDIRVSDALPH